MVRAHNLPVSDVVLTVEVVTLVSLPDLLHKLSLLCTFFSGSVQGDIHAFNVPCPLEYYMCRKIN